MVLIDYSKVQLEVVGFESEARYCERKLDKNLEHHKSGEDLEELFKARKFTSE